MGLRSQHETGLGFGLWLETLAWWWWLGLADLADLGLGLPISATPRRRDVGHAGHAVKHELHPAGQALPCRSQRSGGGAVPISAEGVGGKDLFGWLFLVAEKFHLWWFSVAKKFHLWWFLIAEKFHLWWFLIALVDLQWLWWWRGGKDYGSWLFLVANNNTEE